MGGMNAGETASKIAVETIREWFMPDKLTAEMMSKPELVKQHIVNAIVDADNRIKKEGESDREKEGMGSTVVLAWITGTHAYIAWCGDSRAYCFNTADGLKQLSHDHSYVQELVDSGLLSEDLAFDHPQNNIITRNLGDPNCEACPDIKDYELRDGDLIMLCSDGLCGVLRDSEIETVMRRNTVASGPAATRSGTPPAMPAGTIMSLSSFAKYCPDVRKPPPNCQIKGRPANCRSANGF